MRSDKEEKKVGKEPLSPAPAVESAHLIAMHFVVCPVQAVYMGTYPMPYGKMCVYISVTYTNVCAAASARRYDLFLGKLKSCEYKIALRRGISLIYTPTTALHYLARLILCYWALLPYGLWISTFISSVVVPLVKSSTFF